MEPNWPLAGELLLAASGLWPSGPVTRDQAAAAEQLPKAWAEEMSKLMSGAPATKPWRAPSIRYMATWRRLQAEEDGVNDLLASQILNPDIAAAYKAARQGALDYLKAELVPVSVDDLQGARLLEPSVSQQLRGDQLVAVAGDPGRVVYGLRAGLVSPDSLDVLRTVYPAVDAMLAQIYDIELHRQRTRKPSYRIPWSAEIVLRALLGVPMGAEPAEQEEEALEEPSAAEVPNIEIGRDLQQAQTRTDRVTDLGP